MFSGHLYIFAKTMNIAKKKLSGIINKTQLVLLDCAPFKFASSFCVLLKFQAVIRFF